MLRLTGIILLIITILGLILVNGALITYYYFQRDLPQIYNIKDYKPLTTTDIFDKNGNLLYRLYNQKRTAISIKKIPKHVINAFLSAEDSEFFSHRGVDITTIFRAIFVNLTSGKIKQGGSTITQQVVKTFFLTPERTLSRKIKEAILSFRLERYLTKEEILELYLNQIYFGAGNYGIYEASEYFFSKSPEELTISEAAFLASLVKAPEIYGTLKNPQKVRDRQIYIIRQMEKNGFISEKDAKQYIEAGLQFKTENQEPEISYAISHAIKELTDRISASKLYNGGYKIILTVDKELNELLERSLTDYLDEKNIENTAPLLTLTDAELLRFETEYREKIQNIRRHYFDISQAFKSPEQNKNRRIGIKILKPYNEGASFFEYLEKDTRLYAISQNSLYLGVITNCNKSTTSIFTGEAVLSISNQPKSKKMNNCIFKKGDVIFYRMREDGSFTIANQPIIQGAVVLLDNRDMGILGMSGGYSYSINEFNRVTQAKRQPGSAFKPVIYSYAIETGKYNITSIENDAPVEYTDPQTGRVYRPSNYDREEFNGEMTLLDALKESKNTVSVRLVLSLGLNNIVEFVNTLDMDIEVKPYPSIALGSFETTLLSLVRFYSSLARGGSILKDQIITSIKDENDKEIFISENEPRQIVLPETAFIITRMLKEVVKKGTGTNALINGLNIAGKTGTTNNYTNAWFIGYTPDITLGILIGRDDNKSMGRKATGGNLAAPLFKKILSSEEASKILQSSDFVAPQTIKFINTDIHTGKRCIEENPDCEFLPYREGFEPAETDKESSEIDLMRLEH